VSLKDIIVHLDRGPGCTARFMAAIDLAQRHGATLKGLYPVNHPFYEPQSTNDRDYTDVRDFFINAASKADVNAEWLYADWGVVGVSLTEIISFHAHAADLIVIGQPPPDQKVSKERQEFPEHLILSAGRPVLVFPAAGDHYHVGTKILVAWRGGRESTRALHDALPLLGPTTTLEIVSVTSGENDRTWQNYGLKALRDHLDKHAITADISVIGRGNETVADILLRTIEEKDVDLLVMGGFTYTTRGMPVFGDLARELMRRMTVPVLFSH
jgi:nucleotide-binding universal stress UspA family protein